MSEQPIRHFRDEPLTPVYRRWICAEAGCDGEMKPNGQGFMTCPPQYPHYCESCNRIESSSVTYPRIAYLPLEAIDPAQSSGIREGKS
jgi:hypothetical protein